MNRARGEKPAESTLHHKTLPLSPSKPQSHPFTHSRKHTKPAAPQSQSQHKLLLNQSKELEAQAKPAPPSPKAKLKEQAKHNQEQSHTQPSLTRKPTITNQPIENNRREAQGVGEANGAWPASATPSNHHRTPGPTPKQQVPEAQREQGEHQRTVSTTTATTSTTSTTIPFPNRTRQGSPIHPTVILVPKMNPLIMNKNAEGTHAKIAHNNNSPQYPS